MKLDDELRYGLSPCRKHPDYDMIGSVPNDPNGEMCYICYANNLLYNMRKDIHVRMQKKFDEKVKPGETYKPKPLIFEKVAAIPIANVDLPAKIEPEKVSTTLVCPNHPTYRGVRVSRSSCRTCDEIHRQYKLTGKKEVRSGRSK